MPVTELSALCTAAGAGIRVTGIIVVSAGVVTAFLSVAPDDKVEVGASKAVCVVVVAAIVTAGADA